MWGSRKICGVIGAWLLVLGSYAFRLYVRYFESDKYFDGALSGYVGWLDRQFMEICMVIVLRGKIWSVLKNIGIKKSITKVIINCDSFKCQCLRS